ncbi:MAG: cyclopropane-fatty-acyl-phospholipid synthase family protein [Pseudomonadota bacterium]
MEHTVNHRTSSGLQPWALLLDRYLRSFLRVGRLRLTWPDGRVSDYGDPKAPAFALALCDASLPRRLVMSPELALGEAYMDGTLRLQDDDLHGMFGLLLRNRVRDPGWLLRIDNLGRAARRRIDHWNPVHRARAQVSHHYDLDGGLYDLFLDSDRQYSCAYFPDPDMDLDTAQEAKKRHIAAKLRLSPGTRVLDIGCGWGGMAITLARDYGARVTGVTLSHEQHKLARARMAEAGLTDQVDIRLCDYREVTGEFDRIVSVGMFEHVGPPHYREYFDHVQRLLSADGIALIHFIGRAFEPAPQSPWILKYIFPGGYTPAMSEVFGPLERAHLWCCDMEVWRLHYATTLRHWFDRFTARRGEAEALYDARFYRMWRYYLAASEMTFREGAQAVYQLQLAKTQTAVPLSRDYLC